MIQSWLNGWINAIVARDVTLNGNRDQWYVGLVLFVAQNLFTICLMGPHIRIISCVHVYNSLGLIFEYGRLSVNWVVFITFQF